MASPLQVFLATMAFGAVFGSLGIWAAVKSQSEVRKDR